jgi:hypothetical protein
MFQLVKNAQWNFIHLRFHACVRVRYDEEYTCIYVDVFELVHSCLSEIYNIFFVFMRCSRIRQMMRTE